MKFSFETSKTTFNNDQQGKTALNKTGKWVNGVVEVVGVVGVVGMDWVVDWVEAIGLGTQLLYLRLC